MPFWILQWYRFPSQALSSDKDVYKRQEQSCAKRFRQV